jgi:phosphoribosylglycinamide formyltransferase 1
MMKYGFYVSGSGTRLKLYLRSRLFQNNKNSQVAFVLIDNKTNSELETLCRQLRISFFQYSYKELALKGKNQNKYISDKLLELLDTTVSSYGFIFGGRILQGVLLTKYKYKLINFHPSILPSYKGIDAIDRALDNNALLLGNTAHFVSEELDAGAIIMQSIMPAAEFTDYDQVLNMQIPMINQLVNWFADNRIEVTNNKVTVKGASYKLGSFIPNLEIK